LTNSSTNSDSRNSQNPYGALSEEIIGAVKFINLVKYRDLDRIASARPAHFAYADTLRARGKLAIGGPLIDDHGRRIGLLFIYDAVSRDEALTFAQEDPFNLANALSGYELTEWRIRAANIDLLIAANRAADLSEKRLQRRLFANYAKYDADKSRLATVQPAHWEYDRSLEVAGKMALAGAFADDKGGLFVYNAAHGEEAMSYVDQDPFALNGVFAVCELLEWLIEGVNPDLLTIDESIKKEGESTQSMHQATETRSATQTATANRSKDFLDRVG
jgi:uncharacterized protein